MMDHHMLFWEYKYLQIWGSLVYSSFLLSLSQFFYTVSRIILLCLYQKMLREIARRKSSNQANHILYLTRYRDTEPEKIWKLSHLFNTWNNTFLNKPPLRMCSLRFSRSCLEFLMQMTLQVKGEGSIIIYIRLLAVLH